MTRCRSRPGSAPGAECDSRRPQAPAGMAFVVPNRAGAFLQATPVFLCSQASRLRGPRAAVLHADRRAAVRPVRTEHDQAAGGEGGDREAVPPARPPPHARRRAGRRRRAGERHPDPSHLRYQLDGAAEQGDEVCEMVPDFGGRSSASNIDRPITMLVHSAVQTDVMSPHCRLPSRWRSTWR